MICYDHTESHDQRDIRLCVVGVFPRRQHAHLCAGCRAGLEAMGLSIRIERRSDPNRADRGSRSLTPILRRLVGRAA